MSATKTRPKGKESATFIDKSSIAFQLGVSIQTIDKWIAKGTFPPPHSRPGERKALWLRRHFDAYVDSGAWPKEAFPSRDGE